ncbi:hypothetical protein BH10PLA2_BH10PLA2_32030 [soil metagenome]
MVEDEFSSKLQQESLERSFEEELSRRAFFAASGTMAAGALALTLPGVGLGSPQTREQMPVAVQDLPAFMNVVTNQGKPASARDSAQKSVLKLNSAMNELHGIAVAHTMRNLREQFPVLIGLFTGQGGQMILYPPGKPPIVAGRVPVIYELAKAVAHSPMAIYEVIVPYLKAPSADSSWQGPMRTYRVQNQTALDNLKALDLSNTDRAAFEGVLELNIRFMDRCLERGTCTYAELEGFAHEHQKYLERCLTICGDTQVAHWMTVLDDWKKLLGKDWDKLYAVTNTLYGTRQNNILFTILAQYMGQEAINDRLLLLETSEFTTTPEKMLDGLARIVGDRALGKVFFDDYYLMDVELLSDPSRRAIKEQVARRGMQPLMPPLAPFHSHAWPWRVDPKEGTGPNGTVGP